MTSFNSYYRLSETSRNNLKGSASYSYQYCMNYRRIFLGPKRLLKTRTSEKKRQPFQWKKNVWPIFPVLLSKKNSWNSLWRSTKFFDIYCGFHKSIFQDLRGCWKHKFLKKRQPFQWRKDFGLHFPVLSNMTYVRKLFLRLASSFDYYCGTYKSIFFGLERLLKTQFLKKKAKLPVKKKMFDQFYLVISSMTNLKEHFKKIRKLFLPIQYEL